MTRIRGSEIRQAQRFAREPAESYSARLVDTPKTRAEDSCARINGSLAWRAAEPELGDLALHRLPSGDVQPK